MASLQQKIEFFKLGFFLGLIKGTIVFFVMRSVSGIPVANALGFSILGFLVGMVIGCAITLFLAAFNKKRRMG